MIRIILDGKKMTTRAMAHDYLKCLLTLPDYYGRNLDGLWDILSTYSESISISLVNADTLIESLGDYGQSIIDVFQDADRENKHIHFRTSK